MGDVSRNFNFREFVVSSSYPVLASQIILTRAEKVKIHWLTHIILQPLRDVLNGGVSNGESQIRINVTSCVRDAALNSAVGGVSNSDHLFRKLSCACDIRIGVNTKLYLEIAYSFCYTIRRYTKQFIYYLPYTDERGRQRGNFIHISTFDDTKKMWDVLYCGSRSARQYFRTYEEAENYMRRE